MKKMLIIMAILFIATNLNAQWFLGGEIGLNVNNRAENIVENNTDLTRNRTEVGFLIAPKAGYFFNKKFALGLNLSVGSTFRIGYSNPSIKYKEYFANWGVFPFVKYTVLTYKKFHLALEGRTGVGGAHSFYKIGEDKTEKGYNVFAIGVFNITPILGFNLNDHLLFEAGLYFLNVGYNIDIFRDEANYPYSFVKNSINHNFNIGFNSSSILVLTQLKFGVAYKF